MFFKKDDKPGNRGVPSSDKISARIKKMTTSEVISWLDNSIVNLGQNFDNWRYKDLPEVEVTNSLTAVVALWDELIERSNTNSHK